MINDLLAALGRWEDRIWDRAPLSVMDALLTMAAVMVVLITLWVVGREIWRLFIGGRRR